MNVEIRPLKEEDAYVSVKWRNDPEVFKYTGNVYDHEITIESELNWIRDIIKRENEYRCAIQVDGVYVGNIYLTNIGNNNAEYQIFIGNKDYWGKGIAKKASQLIIDYGFSKLGLDKIELQVRPVNQSAMKLYHRLGFKEVEEGPEFVKMELKKV